AGQRLWLRLDPYHEVWAAMKTSSRKRPSFAQSCVASIFQIRGTYSFSECLGLT
uniref:Uncharacterized protein n=1 Tax=Catagonus wagneri TaxID=51154 RepID=A0A8C3WJ45_9CETA